MSSTKRVEDIAHKLMKKENARLIPAVRTWIEESGGWADTMLEKYGPNNVQKERKGFQLLYVLNHLCPSLHHFFPNPANQNWHGDIDGYNKASQRYFLENTQVGLKDVDGNTIQEGVNYDAMNFDRLCEIVAGL